MIVEFQQVSYAYDRAAAKAARRRAAKHPANGSESEVAADDAHRWGNEPGHLWALDDISFGIEPGEFLGIAGHTGSGKSTLLLLLAGLLSPTHGRVLVDDGSGRPRSPDEFRGTIGVVFQYPEHQLFAPTVLEDVCFGPRNLGLSEQEARRRADEALERVGLDPATYGGRSPFELSGGQQRRVAVAGVLAMAPSVLAMDEPAAGLDPRGTAELLALVQSLQRQGITIVMISHSMEALATYADRVLVLNEGRIVAHDTPIHVFSAVESLVSVGLAAPPALSLARRLRAAGVPLSESLLDESELIDELISWSLKVKRKRSDSRPSSNETASSR